MTTFRRSNVISALTEGNVKNGTAITPPNGKELQEVKIEGDPQPKTNREMNNIAEPRPYSQISTLRTRFMTMSTLKGFKVDDLTNYKMNDQRWTLQRKKIGLKRRTSGTNQRKVRHRQREDMFRNFIRNNFNAKECFMFSKDRRKSELFNEPVCRCGKFKAKHDTEDKPTFEYTTMNGSVEKSFVNDIMKTKQLNGGKFAPLEEICEDVAGGDKEIKNDKDEEGDLEEGETEEEEEDEGEKEKDSLIDQTENTISNILMATGISTRRKHSKDEPGKKDQSAADPPTSNVKKSSWSIATAMREFPTNAYGQIDFVNENTGSNKPAKYVRLSDTSSMDAILSLLTDYWRLFEPTRPHLVISVIGGAKNFRLDGRKKETFNSGLLRAVKSTNAWILTGGNNVGVTKSVGEVVNEGQYIVKVKRKAFFAEEQEHMVRGIKCIGVSPWGYIKYNKLLINKDPSQFNKVRYKTEYIVEKYKKVSLNGDHTHFLLIDDGFRNRYSGADKFKTKLQTVIQTPEPYGLGIPVVLLILEGGTACFYECKMAIKNQIPVVVVANTGRAADLLAYGMSMTVHVSNGKYAFRNGHKKQLLSRIVATMPELEPSQSKACAEVIIECCEHANLITIFDINSEEAMDKYILLALLKANDSYNSKIGKVEELNLSVLWNRPDIADSHIFPATPKWESESLEDLMTTALLEEKVEFVKLFALNGLVMSDYLTVQRLRKLYNDSSSDETHLGRLLEMISGDKNIYLVHVHYLLETLVKKHRDKIYMRDTPKNYATCPSINYVHFDDPYQELLIWAVLSNRSSLARYLWERCSSPLSGAIVSTCIYESLWKSLGAKNTEIREEYAKYKTVFEKLAVEFLEVCYKYDSSNAMGIVERRLAKWGDLDCLELATTANDLMFVSSPCCQASIQINWRRGMIRAPWWAVSITNFLPFLIFTGLFRFQKLGDHGGELGPFQKLLVFYKSPISKFQSHSTSYILFLILYAHVILFNFRPSMTAEEKVLVIWIMVNFLDEVNEVLTEDSTTFLAKLSDYWSSVWNRFDTASYFLSFVALGLRIQPATFKAGRVVYAVNTTVFFIRLFRIYHANYKLGPKLVIFYRMISEVVVFMSLLLIFILGYGIASQALLHPWRTWEETNLSTVTKDIILTPYWQMYGELLLERLQGDDFENCTVNEEWGIEVCENPREYSWVIYVMLVFYLIIGNIMLLNLLIAIFTYVFDEVQEHSMEIWKHEMYKLIREYDKKPALSPPLSVLELIYRLLKLTWKKCCRNKRENLDDYMKSTLKALEIFEKEGLANYLEKIKHKEDMSMDKKIAKMSEKIEKIVKYVEQQEERQELEEDMQLLENQEGEDEEETVGGDKNQKKSKDEKEESTKTTEEKGNYEFGQEISLDELTHALEVEKRIYAEGFASLPFNLGSPQASRPTTSNLIVPRPRSSRLLRTRSAFRRQQEQILDIGERIDSLQNTMQESYSQLQLTIKDFCSKLEQQNSAKVSNETYETPPQKSIVMESVKDSHPVGDNK